jgi:arylsulfatase A-like enzyme
MVQSLDLFPTLLAAAGLPVPPQDGIDLHISNRRAVFAEHANEMGAMVQTRDYQYIVSHGNAVIADGSSLYDVRADPQETRNLSGKGLPAEREMAGLLDSWLAQRRPRGDAPGDIARPQALSDEDAARLRSLGYVHDAGTP